MDRYDSGHGECCTHDEKSMYTPRSLCLKKGRVSRKSIGRQPNKRERRIDRFKKVLGSRNVLGDQVQIMRAVDLHGQLADHGIITLTREVLVCMTKLE